MHLMHCTVLSSEEVAHAFSRCCTSQMQGSFPSETETGQLENWADASSNVLHAQLQCQCVIAQGVISGHKDAAEPLIQLAGAL